MKTIYVNLKSELTQKKDEMEACGLAVYRSRMICDCEPYQNRRYGILVVSGDHRVVLRVMRCRACVKRAGEQKAFFETVGQMNREKEAAKKEGGAL